MILSVLLSLVLSVVPVSGGQQAIDISVWNSRSATSYIASEHPAAVFVRATYGIYPDSKYAAYSAQVLAAKVPLYAYAFFRATITGATPKQQVDALLRVAGNARGYVLDWEGDTYNTAKASLSILDGGLYPKAVIAVRASLGELRAAVDYFHSKGLRVGVYASEGAPFPSVGQDWNWVANYSRKPKIHADVWQYAGASLDRDIIYSPLTALDARPVATSAPVTYISANRYDCSSLPTVTVLAGAPISDLAGNAWGTIPKTTRLCTAGLANGHSGQFVVLIHTSRYSPNGYAWQVVPGILKGN